MSHLHQVQYIRYMPHHIPTKCICVSPICSSLYFFLLEILISFLHKWASLQKDSLLRNIARIRLQQDICRQTDRFGEYQWHLFITTDRPIFNMLSSRLVSTIKHYCSFGEYINGIKNFSWANYVIINNRWTTNRFNWGWWIMLELVRLWWDMFWNKQRWQGYLNGAL